MRKQKKRRGRGLGSGQGKTAGRGYKGQKSRSGGSIARGFEGGQMPLQRRLPKRGFHNAFADDIAVVTTRQLNRFADGTDVTLKLLKENKLVSKSTEAVKIIQKGKLDRKLNVAIERISAGARAAIVAEGGSVAT